MADQKKGQPAQPPRLPSAKAPKIPAAGRFAKAHRRCPMRWSTTPRTAGCRWGRDTSIASRLVCGITRSQGSKGLVQWFSYRKATPERPIIGDGRPPSPLGDIQSDHWLAECTTELINLLYVLGLLVQLEPTQAQLLEEI
jgi:hypothetical protein